MITDNPFFPFLSLMLMSKFLSFSILTHSDTSEKIQEIHFKCVVTDAALCKKTFYFTIRNENPKKAQMN